jgi:hypothetical protein
VHRNTASKQYKSDLECLNSRCKIKLKKISLANFSKLYGFDAQKCTMAKK